MSVRSKEMFMRFEKFSISSSLQVFLPGYGNAVLRCIVDFRRSISSVNSNHGGGAKMTGKFYRGALILVALGSFASVPVLNAQPSPAATSRTPSCTRRKRWTMANRVMLRRS